MRRKYITISKDHMKMKTGEENQKLPQVCSHKTLYVNVYNGFIHNCQNLETTQRSFDLVKR